MPALMVLITMGIPAAVFLIALLCRSRERRRILDALVAASEKGQSLPTEVLSALVNESAHRQPVLPTYERDQRRGAFLVGTAIAFVFLGVALFGILGVKDGLPGGLAVAALGAIPGVIGIVYLRLARTGRKRSDQGG